VHGKYRGRLPLQWQSSSLLGSQAEDCLPAAFLQLLPLQACQLLGGIPQHQFAGSLAHPPRLLWRGGGAAVIAITANPTVLAGMLTVAG
jgi:hypothetical protein